jgi:hypothetical protein
MGASGYEDRVELMLDITEFYDRVGIIADDRELAWLGFNLDIFLLGFRPVHLPKLLDFCREHPEYHVASFVGPERLANKYVPGRNLYLLANGDRNPNLVLDTAANPNRALVNEEMICSALTMFSNTKTGRQ